MLEVPEVMRCMLLDTLKGTEGGLCLAVLEVLAESEPMRCVLLCLMDRRCWR